MMVDYTIPLMDGIVVTRLLSSQQPEIRVVIISMHDAEAFVTINRSAQAPSIGFFQGQGWPYKPTLNLMSILPYAARAVILFISLLLLTWLICAVPVRLPFIALLGVLFILPYLPIMAGGYPYPQMVTPALWANW